MDGCAKTRIVVTMGLEVFPTTLLQLRLLYKAAPFSATESLARRWRSYGTRVLRREYYGASVSSIKLVRQSSTVERRHVPRASGMVIPNDARFQSVSAAARVADRAAFSPAPIADSHVR